MTRPLTVRGGILAAHFRHGDPLETCLAYRQERGIDPPMVAEWDIGDTLASRLGIDHERTVVGELQRTYGDDLVVIGGLGREDADKRRQEAATLDAMAKGARVISGGFLRMGRRIEQLAAGIAERYRLPEVPLFWGEPDLLFRVDDAPSALGAWHYEPGDIKCARSAKLAAQLQVAFYAWLLAEVQEFMPRRGWVLPRPIDPDPGSVTRREPFLIADALPTAELFLREEYWEIVTAEPATLFSTKGYRTPLAAAWAEKQGFVTTSLSECHVAFLPGMRAPARRRLEGAGLRRICDLAALGDEAVTGLAGPGATAEGLRRQRRQALACVERRPVWRDDGYADLQAVCDSVAAEPESEDDVVEPVRLVDDATTIVYFDMESDPFIGIDYLFGYQVVSAGGSVAASAFLLADDATPEAERRVFERFLDDMERLAARGPVVIVHYGSYEPTHLRQLAVRYPESTAGRAAAPRVEALVRRMLDCLRVIQRALVLPFSSYSLKDVAPGLEALPPPGGPGAGHTWLTLSSVDDLIARGAGRGCDEAAARREIAAAVESLELDDPARLLDSSAMMSAWWFERYRAARSPVWAVLMELYNGDDLVATRKVHQWLQAMQRAGGRP